MYYWHEPIHITGFSCVSQLASSLSISSYNAKRQGTSTYHHFKRSAGSIAPCVDMGII